MGSVGNFVTEEVDQGRTTSVFPGLTPSGTMGASGCEATLTDLTKWIGFCEKI